MAGLPKKYAKMGFKKGWKEYKKSLANRKTNKRGTPKRKIVKVKRKVAKKQKRRKRDKRIPFSVAVGLATSVVAAPAYGWSSPMQAIQDGKPDLAVQSFIRSWTGVALPMGGQEALHFNIWDVLNPFSPEAPALKATIMTSIASKVARKLIGVDPFSKIPFLNKYVKFS